MNAIEISARIATCLMLHNMVVQDRVIDGDVWATYVPNHSLTEDIDDEDANAGADAETESEDETEDAIPEFDEQRAYLQRWENLINWDKYHSLITQGFT